MVQPFVSILIPCRNEEVFISKCLDTILENDYPKDKTEILVIDGESSDNTVDIVSTYLIEYPFIKIFHNPGKIFPAAVNIGIRESMGDLVFIIGAHAQYDEKYISSCVAASMKYNADNVGGVLITCSQNSTLTGDIITSALSNPFGVGNSTFRTGSEKIVEADTVFGGCYKRDVFEKIGLFNENLISTSDYEFNKRLKRSEGKIILIPDIKVRYYTRTTFYSFLVNNFRNGYWSIYPIAFVHYMPVSVRHVIPLLFLLLLISLFVLSLFFQFFKYALISILVLYFTVAVFFSMKTLKLKTGIFLPLFFFILHLSYGLGSGYALIKILYLRLFKKMNSSVC